MRIARGLLLKLNLSIQQINMNQERFEKNALALCVKLHICSVESFADLPDVLKRYFETQTYLEVTQYLVWCDRKDGLSYGELAQRYGLTRRQVIYTCYKFDKLKKVKRASIISSV